ncbi:MAG: DUF6766 family protein [Gaiellaceae bacterium]
MRRFLRENSLSLFFLVLLLFTLLGQSFAGQHDHNAEQAEHGAQAISWGRYVASSDFWGAVMENWQSEFLQFSFFIAVTIWLVQLGSNESKSLENRGLESDQRQMVGGHAPQNAPRWAKTRGWRTAIYSNSLLLVMTAIFFLTWAGQSVTNWNVFNDDRQLHGEPAIDWLTYLRDPDFWEKTFQNWQSEFLAVGTLAVFTIYLRQRGSHDSKPVGAPHSETGTSG